jgi:bacillithiol system protein YtxJ
MKMNWIKLDTKDKFEELKQVSEREKVLIFKFSPKCAINYVVRNLLEREWAEGEMKMKTYLLDVISQKELSNIVGKEYNVEHESPQALIIENGKAVFHASHGRILFSELRKFAN